MSLFLLFTQFLKVYYKIKKLIGNQQIFNYIKNGYNSQKIAKLTNKTLKQIDNTTQRIKQKIRNITLE